MTDLPLGMKYYLLILTSSLIEDLNDYGVKWIANEPGIAIRDVEKAFFCARALESRMPDEPGQADPRLWPELMKSIHTIRRVLDVVEKTTFDAVIARPWKPRPISREQISSTSSNKNGKRGRWISVFTDFSTPNRIPANRTLQCARPSC